MRGKNRSLDGRGGRPCFVEKKVEPPTSHHPYPSRGLILEDPKGGKAGRGKEGGIRGRFKCAFERSSNVLRGRGVAHSLEGAGNLLRYVERSLPSEYEERFLLWFEEEEGWMAVPLLTVEGR